MPGAFQDCSPDRWGRNLIAKRHRQAREEQRQADLNDVDFLIGVSDQTRQGALRFTHGGSDSFLDPYNRVPKLIELPRLVAAVDQLGDSDDEFGAVKTLLDAGSGSLGGARPKASVRDRDGNLAIAKFPHGDDEWNVIRWECVTLDIAERAGIATPHRELVPMSDGRGVLVLRRFDRTDRQFRIPYISAMTLLAATDGDWHDYTEVGEHLTDVSAAAGADLRDLYRRVAFNVAVHNTDDHLRNLGFLWVRGGWCLAPAFDINPSPDPARQRVTGIAGATHGHDEPTGLADLARTCRLTSDQVQRIHDDINYAVSSWRTSASRRGISSKEIERFANAFTSLPNPEIVAREPSQPPNAPSTSSPAV